jgi:5-methylcytosine-specific restriction protein A
MRRTYTTLQNAAFFLEHKGICHICGEKIDGVREKWEREHVIPLSMGGADDESNMRPAHKDCHKGKTDQDKANLAKAKRREAKHIGATRPKKKIQSRPFRQGWRGNTKHLEKL